MITILFLFTAALGGYGIGRLATARQIAPMLAQARNETARAIIAEAQAAMTDEAEAAYLAELRRIRAERDA